MRQHGTNSSYSMGCRCRACKDAHNEYAASKRRHRIYMESAFPFQEWLVQATTPRFTIPELAYKTGLSEDRLRHIRAGRSTRLSRRTADALRTVMETP